MNKKLILDTSFLIRIVEKPITSSNFQGDMSGYEILVPGDVIGELENIAKRSNPKKRKKAILALEYAKRLVIMDDNEMTGQTDENIITCAEQLNAIVASLDQELLLKAKNRGICTLTLRRDILVRSHT